MALMFPSEPQRTYWEQHLFMCMRNRGLGVVGVGFPGDTRYYGAYDARTGMIQYFLGLTDEERAMALTHEFVHAVNRPPSPDPEPYLEHDVPSEEHVVNRVSALICAHFGLGDYYGAMRVRSVPFLDDPSDDELATATELAGRLLAGRGQAPLPASSLRDQVHIEVVGSAKPALGRTVQVREPAIDRAHLLTSL